MEIGNPLYPLMERLQGIVKRHPGSILRVLGYVDGLPFFMLEVPAKARERFRICLGSGIHGDEPAGVEAHLRFLEGSLPSHVSFTCFPCMNPPAFLEGTRTDPDGRDLNRLFRSNCAGTPNYLFEQAVRQDHWDLFLDLHEDYEADGFYLLEIASGVPPLGPRIRTALREAGFAVEPQPTLLAMLEREGGYPLLEVTDGLVLVERESDESGLPQAPFMARYHASEGLTFETPSRLPFEERIDMHLVALQATLRSFHRSPVRS